MIILVKTTLILGPHQHVYESQFLDYGQMRWSSPPPETSIIPSTWYPIIKEIIFCAKSFYSYRVWSASISGVGFKLDPNQVRNLIISPFFEKP